MEDGRTTNSVSLTLSLDADSIILRPHSLIILFNPRILYLFGWSFITEDNLASGDLGLELLLFTIDRRFAAHSDDAPGPWRELRA